MKPKISVVVPVYGVEQYLRKCVNSILEQTLTEIEIILVDDGSPDRCPEMVDEFARMDERVKAIHQENQGYGAAVNHGIQQANGEYIGIIESDDWIEPEMMEKLYENATKNQTDISKGMFWKTDSTKAEGAQDEVFSDPSGVDLELAPGGAFRITEWPTLLAFHASLWSAIYRKEFLDELAAKQPLFIETRGASYQDFPFIMKVLCAAQRISVVKQPFVHWRNDPQQVHSTSATGKKALKMVESCAEGVEIVRQAGLLEELKEALYIHVVWTNVGFFYNVERAYRKEYWQKLRKLLLLVVEDKSFRYTYFRKLDKIFLKIITNQSWIIVQLGLFAMKMRRKIRKIRSAVL